MAGPQLIRDFSFVYGAAERLSPRIRRVLARNPGPFTDKGTGTYIVGHGTVAVIDPGPALPDHAAALLAALDGETVSHILVTNTHRDHSPAAAALGRATGAPTLAFGPHGTPPAPGGGEEGADHDFAPDRLLRDGDVVEGPGWHLAAVHTPGHTSNHLCFALAEEKVLFSGDHVMGWSTTVVAPPDGDMARYVASLERLLSREDAVYWPTHGPAIRDPHPHVRGFIAHRRERKAAILRRLADGASDIPGLVAALYAGLDPRLAPAAGRSVHAHLIELMAEGQVAAEAAPDAAARYRLVTRRR